MTKKLLFPYLFIFIVLGCNQNKSQLTNAIDLYGQAILNNDATTAKMALNQIILLDTLELRYQDSLSRIYMKSGNFKAGLKYAEIVYTSGKADGQLKENMALAYQQIGETEKAEEFINSLLQTTKDYKYLFQKIVIQYENGNQPLFDLLQRMEYN